MNSQEIEKVYTELQQRNRTIAQNTAYVEGKNPRILEEDYTYKDPDNRIPIPWAKTTVEDMSGYAAKPGNIKTHYKALDDSDISEYEQKIREIEDYNDTNLENTELYEQGCSQGVAYEWHWTSTALNAVTLTPEYKIIDNSEIIVFYNDSLKPEMTKAMRFFTDANGNMHCIHTEPLVYWEYIKEKGKSTWKQTDAGILPYQRVNVAEFPINRKKMPIFEAEKSIIDANDNLISKSVNEIDRFNALVALFPFKVDKAFIDKLKEMKAIDNLNDYEKWPEYLEKSLQNIDTFYNNLADRLERQFHKSTKIPDMSDDSFAGENVSGVAIAYKILGMEFKAAIIDSYFDKGIAKRFELINDVLESSGELSAEERQKLSYDVDHKRNLPVDKSLSVDIAMKLQALGMPMETILRILPDEYVKDVKETLAKIEEEREDQNEIVTKDGDAE